MAPRKITIADLSRLHREGLPIVALSLYDAVTAGFADEAGTHIILVGDSVGMTMLGYADTISVTLEQSLHHTAAVARGTKQAMVVGDMPFLTYNVDVAEAMHNAGRFMQEGGAEAVKVEGGCTIAPTVARMVEAGIPVMGHIGLLPQRVKVQGRYRIHGREAEEAQSLMTDATALAEAGVFAIVLEGMPAELAKQITESVPVPTIGIGAGVHCSGQIQVSHDLLGLLEAYLPKHARRYAELASEVRDAFAAYAKDVTNHDFPGSDEST